MWCEAAGCVAAAASLVYLARAIDVEDARNDALSNHSHAHVVHNRGQHEPHTVDTHLVQLPQHRQVAVVGSVGGVDLCWVVHCVQGVGAEGEEDVVVHKHVLRLHGQSREIST